MAVLPPKRKTQQPYVGKNHATVIELNVLNILIELDQAKNTEERFPKSSLWSDRQTVNTRADPKLRMKSVNYWTRKLHRWGSIGCCIPLIVVISTGLLLQLKKDWSWVQPATQSGSGDQLRLTWPQILEIASGDPNAQIQSWSDIDRLDVRPTKGIVKIRSHNHWELQLDLDNGEILSSTYRRSDLIESLHDGSWFGDYAKLGIFLPNGLVLLGLWMSGLYLWYMPWGAKRKKRKRLAEKNKL